MQVCRLPGLQLYDHLSAGPQGEDEDRPGPLHRPEHLQGNGLPSVLPPGRLFTSCGSATLWAVVSVVEMVCMADPLPRHLQLQRCFFPTVYATKKAKRDKGLAIKFSASLAQYRGLQKKSRGIQKGIQYEYQ